MKKTNLLLLTLCLLLLCACGTQEPMSPAETVVPTTPPTPTETPCALETERFVSFTITEPERHFVVPTTGCWIMPDMKSTQQWFGEGEMYKDHLLYAHKCYVFQTAFGAEERWLVCSRYDNGHLSLYPETGLSQIWIREADAEPYSEEVKERLVYPVWVTEGTVNIDDGREIWQEAFGISSRDGDIVELTAHGGVVWHVNEKNIIYPDPAVYNG